MPNVIAYKNVLHLTFFFNFYEFPFLTVISDHEMNEVLRNIF